MMANEFYKKEWEIYGGRNWKYQEVVDEVKKLCSYMSLHLVDLRMDDVWWMMDVLGVSFETARKLGLDTLPGFTMNLDEKSFKMAWSMCSLMVLDNSMKKKMLEELSEKSS